MSEACTEFCSCDAYKCLKSMSSAAFSN